MKAKMFPKAGLGKVRMPKRFAAGGNPSANEDAPPPKLPREYNKINRVPERPMTKEELKKRGLDLDKPAPPSRYAEGGDISDTRKRFNEAFAEAREDGETEFEFDGKMYSTRRADEGDEYKAKMRQRNKPEVSDEVTVTGRKEPMYRDAVSDSTSERLRAARSAGPMGRGQSMRDAEEMASVQRRRDDRTAAGLAAASMGPIALGGTAGALGAAGSAAGASGAARAAAAGASRRAIGSGGSRATASAPRSATSRAMRSGRDSDAVSARQRILDEGDELNERMAQMGRRRSPSSRGMRARDSEDKRAGGSIKAYAKGGRIDGIASKGKTRGRIC